MSNLKLTKEECLKALDFLKKQHDYLSFHFHSNYPYSIEMIKTVQSCFEQLINEHFELVEESKASDSKFLHNISMLESEIELLKRENKALADDNEMKCELNEKLSKEVAELKRMMKTFK